ncbi:MAG TPA: DUF6515 family protein [Ferruginibacter sp.]|nr:DUF6515 family protein [Ferruginibacter sp.]
MKKSTLLRFSVLVVLSLILSVSLFAQHGRRSYGNSRNHSRNYSYYPRPHVSVNIGPRYNYRHYPRPVYRSRPVYRPIYRPIYRSPYAYGHFGPRFGVRINVLPVGYSRIYVGPSPYYYNSGVYYRPYSNGGGYEVIAPPLGAVVAQLPSDAKVTVIDGQKYYQVGGTFYQEEVADNDRVSYRVVGTDGVINTVDGNGDGGQEEMSEELYNELPAIGNRYDALPEGSKVEIINQQKYFIAGGVYYREVIEGDKIRYEVTSVE